MFLYFLPDSKNAKPETLKAFGLSSLFDGKPATRETARGPGDQPGLLVCNGRVDQIVLDYTPNDQTWLPRVGSTAWTGINCNAPPTPTGLARDSQVAGVPLTLADGNTYLIPKLRVFHADQLEGPFVYAPNVEQTLKIDDATGDLVPGDVIGKYTAIWDEATAIGDTLLASIQKTGATSAGLSDAKIFGFAARVLAINYRIGNAEIALAKLLQTDMAVRIMQIAIDWDTLRANLGNRLRRAVPGTPTPV